MLQMLPNICHGVHLSLCKPALELGAEACSGYSAATTYHHDKSLPIHSVCFTDSLDIYIYILDVPMLWPPQLPERGLGLSRLQANLKTASSRLSRHRPYKWGTLSRLLLPVGQLALQMQKTIGTNAYCDRLFQ